MLHLLNETQVELYEEFQRFVEQYIIPDMASWEKQQSVPREIISQCANAGFLGNIIPKSFGGQGWDNITFGLLNEAMGRGSSSLTGLFTVQSMVSSCLIKWGTKSQQERWLRRIATGEYIAAFAITEPSGGSDINGIQTRFDRQGEMLRINGQKQWITFSEIADVFLVFGKLDGDKPLAAVVERNTPGLEIEPIKNMMGFRAAHLSKLTFNDCLIKKENLIGKPGFGLSLVANLGLHYGRISTSWSSVGLIRGCLEAAANRVSRRMVNGAPIGDLGIIRSMITEMGTDLEAARMLCWQMSFMEDANNPLAYKHALMAKYLASKAAVRASGNAVQIFGASGCHESNPISSFYWNAKVMEIIEGTTQVHEDILGKEIIDTHKRKKYQISYEVNYS